MKNTGLHIPEDVWSEVLCRLPVKSLLICRCVSKSWLSLIDNRDFARLHLKNFKNNRDETHLIVVHSARQNVVVRCSGTFEINSETLLTLGVAYRQGCWNFVCAIDGLILLRSVSRNGASRFRDLKVWNPSIRKFHEFPSLPEIETPPDVYLMDEEFGLGYDPVANDYKHVKLICLKGNVHSVAIYTLRTGSWKIIQFQGRGCSWHWELWSTRWRRKVYLQGSLYILARDAGNHSVLELVSFDLSSEVFSSIRLPDGPYFQSSDFRGWGELALIDGGCSVAVLDTNSREKSVWVLESSGDESKSVRWTKRYSFHVKYNQQFLYFKKNGDILTRRHRQETVTAETGKKTVKWDQVASYNVETDEYKTLEERKGSSYTIKHVSAYVESLILLR